MVASESEEIDLWWLGVSVYVVGSVLINLGSNMIRKGHAVAEGFLFSLILFLILFEEKEKNFPKRKRKTPPLKNKKQKKKKQNKKKNNNKKNGTRTGGGAEDSFSLELETF